jgi:hypothetical protein
MEKNGNPHPQEGIGLIAAERERLKNLMADEGCSYVFRGDAVARSRDAIGCAAELMHKFGHEPAALSGHGSLVRDLITAAALLAEEIDRHRLNFKKACNEFAVSRLGFEIFDERDDYDLENLEWIGVDPEAFVREHFAEDFWRVEYEADQQADERGAAEGEEEKDNGDRK